MAGGSRSQAR
jgi:hypothetical protein